MDLIAGEFDMDMFETWGAKIIEVYHDVVNFGLSCQETAYGADAQLRSINSWEAYRRAQPITWLVSQNFGGQHITRLVEGKIGTGNHGFPHEI
jgi:hypothetical protein